MRIALCCKEPLFREALASLLGHEGNFDVVAKTSEPRACITGTKEQRAQIIVVDTRGLDQSDLEFLMGARAYGDFGVVMIADEDEAEQFAQYTIDAMRTRNSEFELFKAIRDVGASFIKTAPSRGRNTRGTKVSELELTRRECEVALLVAKGYSNRRIAAVTGLREQSIKNLVSVVMRKLKCENRVQIALRMAATAMAVLETPAQPEAAATTSVG